ncbi:hypothetical protein HDU93_008448 [Gonapodya sp. JEL0774]|nr:hypothetical protein HDU93_008448 [Gonapodya sp. JEL0774]
MSVAKLAIGAASAVAAGILVNEELGFSRDWDAISSQKKTAQLCAAETAAGRFSNVDRFLLHAKRKPDAEYLVFQNSPGAGDTVDPDGFPNTRRYTWRETDMESNRLANFMLATGIKPGDMIAILYENTPEFIFLLLAAWKIGCSVAFQNYNQRGRVFLHSFGISKSTVLFFEPTLANIISEEGVVEELSARGVRLICYTNTPLPIPGKRLPFDFESELLPASELRLKYPDTDIPKETRAHVRWTSLASLIYTSGTTGLPKAATMTHARVFAGNLRFYFSGVINESDRGFVVAPLFHSGAQIILQLSWMLGIPFICTRKFSASKFFQYAAQTKGTVFHYVGEILRQVFEFPFTMVSRGDRAHSVRKCLGNGLRADIWDQFRDRFGIQMIGELYGSTEGCGTASTLNTWGRKGVVGFMGVAYRLANAETMPQIVKIDPITEELVRGPDGFCIPCGPNEPGEFIGKVIPMPAGIKNSNWDGYYGNPEASNKKVMRNVMKKGDETGDLLMRDRRGWIYFVDRLGDTFRWKGENVSTMEVRDIMMKSNLLDESNVYGVTVPSFPDGRAGMAAVVLKDSEKADEQRSLVRLGQFCQRELPHYAVPRFIRVLENMDSVTTVTFKHRKVELQKEGFDIKTVNDRLYFYVEGKGYVPLTPALYNQVVGGKAKL